MTVTCEGYVLNNNRWVHKCKGSAQLKSSASEHAERATWGKLPSATCYALVQNAYPCHSCHSYFMAESLNGHAIIIKIEANEGAYSADHGFGMKGSVPCIIYYHGGQASYCTITDVMQGGGQPPQGFPTFPEVP